MAATEGGSRSLAQQIDETQHKGLAPYTSCLACTIFMHMLAFDDPLRGVKAEHLRFSVSGPGADVSFIEDARKRFVADSR